MDTEQLIQIVQRVSDRAKDNPDLQPGLDQLKRLLKALEGGITDADLAGRILAAVLMLDISIGRAKAPYSQQDIEAIMGDIPETSTGAQGTPASGKLEFDDENKPAGPTVPTPNPNPKTSEHWQGNSPQNDSTNPYLDYMHGNSKLY